MVFLSPEVDQNYFLRTPEDTYGVGIIRRPPNKLLVPKKAFPCGRDIFCGWTPLLDKLPTKAQDSRLELFDIQFYIGLSLFRLGVPNH